MKEDEGEGTNERMKIVIGYDGSEHADAALDDLRWAGLPRDAEVLIISIAEAAMPPLSVSGIAENGLDPERIASALHTHRTRSHRRKKAPVIDSKGEVIGIVSDCDLFLKQKRVRRLGIHAPTIFDQFIEP